MRFTTLFTLTGILFAAALLASCGGGDNAGIAEFNTVSVTASTTANLVPAALCGVAPQNYTNDAVGVDLKSTKYTYGSGSIGIPSSVVRVNNVVIQYRPVDAATPAIPNQYNGGIDIQPGETATLQVYVAPASLKDKLVSTYGFVPCTSTYTYNVYLTFNAVEVNTNNSVNFTAPALQVTFR